MTLKENKSCQWYGTIKGLSSQINANTNTRLKNLDNTKTEKSRAFKSFVSYDKSIFDIATLLVTIVHNVAPQV